METQNYVEHGHLQMQKVIKRHCTQTFVWINTPLDLTPPTYLVELSCGVNTDPASIAALKYRFKTTASEQHKHRRIL